MSYGTLAVTAIGMVVNASNASKNRQMAKDQFNTQMEIRNKEQQALEVEKQAYKNMEFKNPFADMENVYEDLTVNQQQARFQAQQGAQQRANIMQGLRGAAGSSGIAGLAQSLANQGALQTQRISASIGLQESANQVASAKGAGAVQIAERQGDQWVAQQEADRQATLLGMQMGATTGANLGVQQAQANQMNAEIASQQATASMLGQTAQAFGSNIKTDKAGNVIPFWQTS